MSNRRLIQLNAELAREANWLFLTSRRLGLGAIASSWRQLRRQHMGIARQLKEAAL